MLRLILSTFIALFSFTVFSQNTLGTIINTDESLQGYTFFSPFNGTSCYLVDNCGGLVNQWNRGTRPGLSAYLLENGLIFRTYKVNPQGPFTSASNGGGLELVDWNNNTIWSYEINSPTQLSHHDAVYMPNGNILVLTWELVYEEELIELGRDPNRIASEAYMWSERIIELEPVGGTDANIVWEWHIKDHYIQDFDPNQLNYGVVAEHPELYDINLAELDSPNSNSPWDWNHFNAIDYNEDLDQILISVRNSDEIWIIDHSTTTEEAASHEGGRYGKGGDILFRWGNAYAYDRASLNEQQLFGQHGTNWIRDGLDDAGKILIFNNGNGQPGPDYSTGVLIEPLQDEIGGYILPEEGPLTPTFETTLYGDASGETLYSPYLSNAQRLSNGNTLMNYGSIGTMREVTPNRTIVWEYIIPLFGNTPATQGQNVNNNWSFRAYKYPEDYAGLQGQDLTATATIENGEPIEPCALFTSTQEITSPVKWWFNTLDRQIHIEQSSILIQIQLIDVLGRIQLQREIKTDDIINLPSTLKGVHYLLFRNEDGVVKSYPIYLD